MSEYSGRVIDGPWEGKSYASPSPYFYIALQPPIRAADWLVDALTPMQPVSVTKAEYRWSYPLRGWVFDWSSARNSLGRIVA